MLGVTETTSQSYSNNEDDRATKKSNHFIFSCETHGAYLRHDTMLFLFTSYLSRYFANVRDMPLDSPCSE